MRGKPASTCPASILVVGVGNRWRRDDGAGLVVAEELRALSIPHVTVEFCDTDPLTLLARDLNVERLILIDAVQAPRGPCRVHRFDGVNPPLKREFPTSSHGFGLAETLELAHCLSHWPDDTVIYAVEGWNFSHGEGLSPEAAAAVQTCVQMAVQEIAT